MIVETGHFALWLALAVAMAQASLPLWGAGRGSVGLMRLADRAAIMQFAAVALSFAALTAAFVRSDFSVRLVALNSHAAKPLIYKITGVWANHEGSMLLWVLVLALAGAAVAAFARSVPLAVRARVLAVQAMIGVAFYLFILITSNPFERLPLPPIAGQGMNPLLQDIGIALHPPFLYLGYVGFSTAFSFAVAALIRGRVDPAWARWARPWILGAWAALTVGIALGSWWAYYELGWGGFWFWDPVENASFMPWLVGTALLHSAVVVEKREALVRWTLLLAIVAFAMSLMGTFLVRSGVLSSVHSFANDPERGVFILAILGLALVGSLTLFALRAPSLPDRGVFSPFSREGGLLANNVLLAVAAAVVMIGTLYPLWLEVATGDKVTVGPPYFNATFGPIFALAAALAAVGPFLGWKRARVRPLLPRLAPALLATGLAVLTLAALGHRAPLGLAGVALAVWLGAATLLLIAGRAGLPRTPPLQALGRIARAPRSAWGLWLGHGGLALVVAGVTAVTVWKAEAIQVQAPGMAVESGGYSFTLLDVATVEGPNYRSSIATVRVAHDDEPVAVLFPERRWYPVERKNTTEAGIATLWHGDLYAVLGDPDGTGRFVTRFYYNPGIPWIWLGAALMGLGGLVSLSDRRLRVGAPTPRRGTAAQAVPA